eukprot:786560-Pyramimonas_sp.AAC.1
MGRGMAWRGGSRGRHGDGNGRPREATGGYAEGHRRPREAIREATGGHGRPPEATAGHGRPREAAGGSGRQRAVSVAASKAAQATPRRPQAVYGVEVQGHRTPDPL